MTISCNSVPSNGSINDLGITFGFQTPPSGTVNGTIVFLSPEGGTAASEPASGCPTPPCYNEATYFEDYLNTYKYQVVQTAWDKTTDPEPGWEDTGTSTKYVGYAAGRVAAFLSWAYGSSILYGGVNSNNSQAGMCAQGNSAGGGGIAYFLAWYMGQTGYPGSLDHAEFLSSPPLSDIERGCKKVIPDEGDPVTICSVAHQLGCSGVTPWTASAYYTNALSGVQAWTDQTNQLVDECRSTVETEDRANEQWKDMSIVDDGVVSTFNYPKTSMTAWLCSSVYNNTVPMNNSSSQAQLFFQEFTNGSQLYEGNLTINGVPNCNGSEDVTNALTPQKGAIELDMKNNCTKH